MNFILEPSIFYLSEEDWEDEIKQDDFIIYFNKTLKLIELNSDFKLLWSDNLESLLWESPIHPPWRGNKDFKNKYLKSIIRKLNKIRNIIETNHSFITCDINPIINYNEKYDNAFKSICSRIVEDNIEVNLLISPNQSERDITKIKCTEPETLYNCKTINSINKCRENENLINKFWPSNMTEKDIFEKFMNIIIDPLLTMYTYSFSDNFIKNLIKEKHTLIKTKIKIINTINKRLNMSTADAKVDGGLLEEIINGESRIRVTQVIRIHFKINNNCIDFINYYNESSHDDPL